MRAAVWCAVTALMFAVDVAAADFGAKGGPEPANSESFRRRLPFRKRGTKIGEATDESKKRSVP